MKKKYIIVLILVCLALILNLFSKTNQEIAKEENEHNNDFAENGVETYQFELDKDSYLLVSLQMRKWETIVFPFRQIFCLRFFPGSLLEKEWGSLMA